MVQVIQSNQQPQTSFLEKLGLTAANVVSDVIPAYLKGKESKAEKYKKDLKEFQEEQHLNSYLDKIGLGDAKNLPREYKKRLFDEKMKEQGKTKKEPLPKKPISSIDISKIMTSMGLSARDRELIGPEETEKIIQKARQATDALDPADTAGREDAIRRTIIEQLNPNTQEQQQSPLDQAMLGGQKEQPSQLTPEEEDTIWQAGEKGIQSSIAGRMSAIAQGVPYSEYEKSVELKNPGVVNKFVKGFTKMMIGNMPLHAAGGTLGAKAGAVAGSPAGPFGIAAGGVLGGGAGFMALPAVIETGLEEYHKYKERGGEGTFEDFVQSAGKTVKTGLDAAIEGAMFSTLSQAMPLLKQIPGADALFKKPVIGKAAEKVAKGAVEATGILGAKSFSERRIPSSEEVIDTMVQVVGFNLFDGLPSKAKESVLNRVKKSGMPPEQAATELKARIEKGEVKDAKDVVRVVNDITKTFQGAEKEAGQNVIETLGKVKAPKPQEMAETLSKRPVEEALEYEKKSKERREKAPTEKEQVKRDKAEKKAEETKREIEKIKEELPFLEEQKTKGSEDNRKFANAAFKSKKAEIVELTKKYEALDSIAKKGIEPFSEEGLREPIKKHMEELEIAAKDPSSTSAQEWKSMFSKDQKHVKDFEKILEQGKLPEPQFKDRYIKTLETYQKAYDNMMKDLNESIKSKNERFQKSIKANEHDYDLKKEIDHMQRKFDMLVENRKINEAKIGKQKDKLSQLYELKKPGSALTKQILKNMRKDLVDLQHDFIKQKTELDAFEKKTESVAKGKIKDNVSLLKEYQKNPSKDVLKKIAETNKISITELKEVVEQTKVEAEKIAEHVKKGATQKETVKEVETYLSKLKKRLSDLPAGILYSIVLVELQDFIKEKTGYSVPLSFATLFTQGSELKKATGLFVPSLYKQYRKSALMDAKKSEYKKVKTPGEKIAFDKKLKNDFTKAQRDEIMGLSSPQ